jgi:hypothetical protein
VNVFFAGLPDDGPNRRVHQEVNRVDGKQSALLTIDGAWIHLDTRKLVAPPQELLDILRSVPRTDDFVVLRTVLRGSSRDAYAAVEPTGRCRRSRVGFDAFTFMRTSPCLSGT